MEALAASGDISAALERARAHASAVRQELDAEVDTSVNAIAARLRSKARVVDPVAAEAPRATIEESGNIIPGSTGIRGPGRARAVTWGMAIAAVIGIGAVAAVQRPRDRGTELVIVADFETAAVDSQIGDALTDVTRRVLRESRSLAASPDARVLAARQRLHVPPAERLTLASARRIAIGDGIRSIVAGSLKPFGGSYVISLHLVSASSGEVLATAEQDGIVKGQVFAALDTLTRLLRKRAGDDLHAIGAQPSILALTSSSLEAMTDYVTALHLPRDSVARAVALLREAVTLDSSFASALWQLSRVIELEKPATDAEHRALLARAWNHRDGLTEYEQLRVEIAYKYSPNGTTPDIIEDVERLRRIVERYPNAVDARILAEAYLSLRDLAAAERAYRLVIALDSLSPDGYYGLIDTHRRAKRIELARSETDAFARRFPGASEGAISDAFVSYAEGRRDRTREISRRLSASPGPLQPQIFGYIQVANLDLLEGRVAAFERGLKAKDSVVGPRPLAPWLPPARMVMNYWVTDHPDKGLGMLESTLARYPSARFSLRAAEFYAQFGRPDSARALLAARGPTDAAVYARGTDTLPVWAWIDLAEGRPRDAARKFRESQRFVGGNTTSQTSRDAETGLAFERAGLSDSALVTYENYLNAAPALELDAYRLVWVLEHAARLYEERGDRRKARAAYARVVELWKDADPDLQPRVSHARERAAALR
jgi:tetratricopeptide (TPR) repeat protein